MPSRIEMKIFQFKHNKYASRFKINHKSKFNICVIFFRSLNLRIKKLSNFFQTLFYMDLLRVYKGIVYCSVNDIGIIYRQHLINVLRNKYQTFNNNLLMIVSICFIHLFKIFIY